MESNESIANKLSKIETLTIQQINQCSSSKNLLELKTKILGRKSEFSSFMKTIGTSDPQSRKKLGEIANKTQKNLENAFNSKLHELQSAESELEMKNEGVSDYTLPGKKFCIGNIHPLTKTLNEIVSIFNFMGYSTVNGPEIETDYYNFEALNIPKNHPARDTQDTFYINAENLLLRTQTSGVQIHVMEKTKPPIKIISPGRVFRSDAIDATHSPIFHQLEGLCVDENVNMANLKNTLEIFVKNLYGSNVKTRFRPHHFPFTEPSAEMDISCFACGGCGCPLCKNEGFIEILGCGMVHEAVLRRCEIDPEKFSGFAFGFGIERIAMMRYKINDLRLFYENDLNFLNQF